MSVAPMSRYMTSLSHGRVFCLESQKIDGTEYLRGSTDLAIFLYYWTYTPFAGVYKIENKWHFVHVKFSILGLEIGLRPKT